MNQVHRILLLTLPIKWIFKDIMNDQLIHEWMVSHLTGKLSRTYDEVKANLEEDRNNEFKGCYPDLILSNHGMVVSIVEVETNSTITAENAAKWKELSVLGVKLILMVPKTSKAKVIDLLWKQGIADNTSVGSYDLHVSMP